jgi:two-component system, NtrC family, sensor kinase
VLSKWPIRIKLLVGLGLLLLLVAILSSSGLYAGHAYRGLVKNLSWRAEELPLAAKLSRQVGYLGRTLSNLKTRKSVGFPDSVSGGLSTPVWAFEVREDFRMQLAGIEETIREYGRLLKPRVLRGGSSIADDQRERETIAEIEDALDRVHRANSDQDWMFDEVNVGQLESALNELQDLSAELPSHLHDKLKDFAPHERARYHAMIAGTWVTAILAGLILALFVRLFYLWIFRPLGILIDGSRHIAAGEFNYRIHLKADDEMAELAEAMNDMTARFEDIRDDLDRQVQERTRQVVRSEQLASVGFLAAGVAHEINNPLASIALCAESLESRFADMIDESNEEHAVAVNYLRMIQSEAFRCKGITEKLLDFSRVGQTERLDTELGELVASVIEMIGHLGRYQNKPIHFHATGPVVAPVNSAEIKQIVLNLLTNSLDSLSENGTVEVRLDRRDRFAELSLVDNGCGMTPEVLQHVFEPFFTRRRSGQGTGLGLSITHRIVSDHGGDIEAYSDGLGKGSTFKVRLPLAEKHKESKNHYKAA